MGASKGSVDSGANIALLPALLDFIYTGVCSVNEALLVDVLESAERLGMPALVGSVEEAIEQREVTGIIGFEQGGLVAAMVAARAALGE